jgi:hypothetical protein
LATGTANAQSIFSVGVLGGAPFTNAVSSTPYLSPNFVVGPALQVNLPLSLRFEVDALYRPVKFDLVNEFFSGQVSGSQWQFPFLLQDRFKAPLVKPFVEAGVSFDHLADISAAAKEVSGTGQLLQQSHASFVLGGGVDVKIPFIRLSGELRYIHEGSADFAGISNLNQAEVLVGIHF